jgi:HK97 family phage portal protein
LGKGRGTEADEITRATAYALSLYVYAAMQYRAHKIAEVPIYVARETDYGEEWVSDHPLAPVLENPNPDMDMGTMLMATSFFLDMDAEVVWNKTLGTDGVVVQMYPFEADTFEVTHGPDRLYQQFTLQHAYGTKVYEADEVIYFREPSPHLTNKPVSRLDVAVGWANLGKEVENGIKSAFRNGVMPVSIFTYPEQYNPDQETRQRNKEELSARYGGQQRRGEPMALYGGLKAQFTEIGLNNLLPTEILDRVEANVSLVFGVRPEVLGSLVGLKNSPWSHMDEARRITYDDIIEPVWKRLERALTRQLLSQQDRDRGLYIRVDSSVVRALQEDELQKARIAARNSDIWTIDERRMYTGMQPIGDERGNEIGEGRTQDAGIQPVRSSAPPPTRHKSVPNSRKDLVWARNDIYAKSQEPLWESAARDLLKQQSKEIQALFNENVKHIDGVITVATVLAFLVGVEAYLAGAGATAVSKAFEPLLKNTAQAAASSVAIRLGVDWGLVQPNLDQFIAQELNFLKEKLGDTLGNSVARTVQNSLDERKTFWELRRELETLPEVSPQRAQLIARTETTRALNTAQLYTTQEYGKAVGATMQKQWISSRDERVREEHQELDNDEWIDADLPFDNGLMAPGEPNCRCTLDYRMAPDSEAVVDPNGRLSPEPEE